MSRPLALNAVGLPLLAALFLAAVPPSAHADGQGYPGAYAGWIRSHGAPSFYRGPSGICAPAIDRLGCGCASDRAPCAPYVFSRGYGIRDRCHGVGGTPWTVMRRYLAPGEVYRTWHRHPRSWWIRRWPYRFVGAPGYGGHLCQGTDRGPDGCPLLRAALDDAAPAPVGEDLLIRGLERFHVGAHEKAAEDFRAATDADPAAARAWLGRVMCAFLAKDWKEAAASLRRLAALGELDGRDRLDLEAGGEDLSAFRRLADALATWTQVNFHDADAQLVCGWALAVDGRTQAGRAHLRAALRWRPGDPAAVGLLADLDGATPPRAAPSDVPAAEAPLPVEAAPPALEAAPPPAEAPPRRVAPA